MIPIYIISYRGTNSTLVPKRIQYHKQQLNNLREIFPDSVITVVAQDYGTTQDEPQVDKYIHTGQMYPAQARNILLKEFYASDEDWGLFIDDDILLQQQYHPQEFFNNLTSGMYNTDPITVINPSYGMLRPINGPLLSYKDLASNNWILEATTKMRSGLFVLRNLRKFKGKEYYFNEELKTNEDYDFGCQLIANNMHVHTHWMLVANDLGQNTSVLMDMVGSNVRFDDTFVNLEESWDPKSERDRFAGKLFLHRKNHTWDFNMSTKRKGKRTEFTFTENSITAGNTDPLLNLFDI